MFNKKISKKIDSKSKIMYPIIKIDKNKICVQKFIQSQVILHEF